MNQLDLFSGKHKDTEKRIHDSLENIFSYLEVGSNLSGEIIDEMFETLRNGKDIIKVEKQLRKLIKAHGLGEKVKEKLKNRSNQIYSQIKGYVAGKTVLDLGCGNGKVGEALYKDGLDVKLVDNVDYNESDLPMEIYDSRRTSLKDGSVDTTLLLVVLHHCDKPTEVIEEAMRVTKKRLVVIESIFLTEDDRKFNIFIDWFYNRIFSYEDVNVPLNFRTPDEWKKLFKEYGLKLVKEEDLGIDIPIVPEHHWLFVLEKSKTHPTS